MSNPTTKKIIAVTTATGTQGYGVVQELLKEGTFAVRALTRYPDGPKAQSLAKQGVEVVKADAGDVESLVAAFAGVYGVYGNTDFWQLLGYHNFNQKETQAHETQYGKNLVDAAKQAGVQHFVWSTFDSYANEGLVVHHFDSKYDVNEYLASSGIPHWTLFYTSGYYSNTRMPMIEFLKKDNEGKFYLDMPIPTDTPVHYFDGGEVGLWVVPIFLNTPKYTGQRVDAVSELISTRKFGETITHVTGIPIRVTEITEEEFWKPEFRASVSDGMWRNMSPFVKGLYKRDLELSNAVASCRPTTFEEFLKKDKTTRDFLGLTTP